MSEEKKLSQETMSQEILGAAVEMIAGVRAAGHVCYAFQDVEGLARCWHFLVVLSAVWEQQNETIVELHKHQPDATAFLFPTLDPHALMVLDESDEEFSAFHLEAIRLSRTKNWPVDPTTARRLAEDYFNQAQRRWTKEGRVSRLARIQPDGEQIVRIEQVFKLGADNVVEADGDMTVEVEVSGE